MRIALILLAVLSAVGAGFMVKRYLDRERARMEAMVSDTEPAPPPIETVDVLVVTGNLPIAGQVNDRLLAWQAWPKENLNPSYIVREQEPDARETLLGAAARQPLFAGEPLTEAKLVKPGTGGFLAAVLESGKRAVTVKVDEAAGVAGLVFPNDRVDVVLTHQPPTLFGGEAGGEIGSQQAAAETILRDLRVLAVDQALNVEGEGAKVARTVTLEVDPQQAEVVNLGRSMGSLSLVLRSAFGDRFESRRGISYTRDVEISGVMRAGMEKRQPRYLVAARALSAGTLLRDGDVGWGVAEDGIVDGDLHYVEGRDPIGSLRGALVAQPMKRGEPVLRDELVRSSEASFVGQALRPGFRAISIAVDSRTAVTGFVSPGDIVDVIFTDQYDDVREGAVLTPRFFGETVARAMRVLSLDTSNDGETPLAKPEVAEKATATLEVTPKQAEMVAVAATMGELTLILRPMDERMAMVGDPVSTGDPPGSFTVDVDFSSAIRSLVDPTQLPTATPANGVATAEGGRGRAVKIHRANQVEVVTVPR